MRHVVGLFEEVIRRCRRAGWRFYLPAFIWLAGWVVADFIRLH